VLRQIARSGDGRFDRGFGSDRRAGARFLSYREHKASEVIALDGRQLSTARRSAFSMLENSPDHDAR